MTLTPFEIAVTAFQAAAAPIDVFARIGYRPQPPQQAFHDATEFDVVYGGAAGGGKTAALVADDLRDAVRYPGIRIGVFRRTYDELEESVLAQLRRFDYAALGARLVTSPKPELKFANGSVIRYRHAATVKDASRRQGGEYQKVTVDERTLMPPDVVEALVERLRTSSPFIPVIGLRSGTNPGGIGHAAVKQIVEATDHGRRVWADEHGHTHRFIPAKATDNPHLDPGYLRVLDAIPDPKRRAAMRDGDWDTFSGQFFDSWRRERHVVRPFQVPNGWRRLAGIDYGFAAPWAVEWLAVDSDGRAWVYRELYRARVLEREQAALIARLEDEARETVVHHGDPAMWSRTGEAPSPAQAYAAAGVRLIPAVNDRVPGWQRVHTFLADGPACPLHRDLGWDTCPMLHVFDTCEHLIRTLPSLPHDGARPEDVDSDAEDHAPDALRYALMAAPNPRQERPPRAPFGPRRPSGITDDLLATSF